MKETRELGVERAGIRTLLLSPEVGWLTCVLPRGRAVVAGEEVGRIRTLGRSRALVVPDGVSGRIVNGNLGDYLLPTHADMPAFEVHLLDEHDPHLPGGVKGIGMLGTTGTAAAIANAVWHATGRRVRRLPIRLEDLL